MARQDVTVRVRPPRAQNSPRLERTTGAVGSSGRHEREGLPAPEDPAMPADPAMPEYAVLGSTAGPPGAVIGASRGARAADERLEGATPQRREPHPAAGPQDAAGPVPPPGSDGLKQG